MTTLTLEDDMSREKEHVPENLERLPPLTDPPAGRIREKVSQGRRPVQFPLFRVPRLQLRRLRVPRVFRYVRNLCYRALGVLLWPVLTRRRRTIFAIAAVAYFLCSSSSARLALQTAAAAAGRPLHDRAAFTWQEHFDEPKVIEGLALHEKSASLTNYEMTFQAKVNKKSIGWVVRADKPDSYYVFKLNQRGRDRERDGLKYDLTRSAVVAGETVAKSEQPPVPFVVKGTPEDFLEISVRVTEEMILTQVNGFGVDTWKKPKLKPGGWGFLADKGESFSLRSYALSGNEDFLGLFLYGAEETLKSVKKKISRPGDRAAPPAAGSRPG